MKRSLNALLFVLFFAALCCPRAAAYSELHIQKNMYPKKEPDVIADTITRTSSRGPLPVFLAIHHSNIFPVELVKVTLRAEFGNGTPPSEKTVDYGLRLKQLWWHDLQHFDLPADFSGTVTLNVSFLLRKPNGSEYTVKNNNQLNGKHPAMRIFAGAPQLPNYDNWFSGDPHNHSWYSENQVEFGAPIEAEAAMAEAVGLNWLAVTDHSFDLDDVPGDSEHNDPALPRWKSYLEEVAAERAKHPRLALLTGEELSCGNAAGQNVHSVVLNPKHLYIGNGDGFEGGNTPDLKCAGVAAGLDAGEAMFAAHPICELTSVEILVINRGNWAIEDMAVPGLSGLQAWNYTPVPGPEGFAAWKSLLLKGNRLPLIAGTDAHGSFSEESGGLAYPDAQSAAFGQIRTAVFLPDGVMTPDSVIASMKAGRAVVTSGPMLTIEARGADGQAVGIGGEIRGGGAIDIAVRAVSSSEFGPVVKVRILTGETGAADEKVLAEFGPGDFPDAMKLEKTAVLSAGFPGGYVRAEAVSETGGVSLHAFTNPMWIVK